MGFKSAESWLETQRLGIQSAMKDSFLHQRPLRDAELFKCLDLI
jgi:hypothetical protein